MQADLQAKPQAELQADRVVTRFAPSPTGFLHIGGARTALFNWLFARHDGGRFLLRIEDTDRARSTPEATQAILDGLAWLGLEPDEPPVSQFSRAGRHAEVARRLLAEGKAYKCFATPEEIAAWREAARAEKRSTLFRSPWRDADPADHPDRPYVIRLRTPDEGETVIRDVVQGEVRIRNAELDDMVLLRSDGTPVYMLAVVVDDHDMGVTHVIRGDDHLMNAARQIGLYRALGWKEPVWAHIPLIHGPDGRKLSKRHGALGVDEYRRMGYPARALRNYLARLGWSHGDAEYFTDEEAIAWFSLEGINRAPARFDFAKLEHLSGRHIAAMADDELLADLLDFMRFTGRPLPEGRHLDWLRAALGVLKTRAKTYPDLIEKANFALAPTPITPDDKARKAIDPVSLRILSALTPQLQNASWTRDDLEALVTSAAEAEGVKFGKIAGAMRALLAGRSTSPSVFDMMTVLGRDETLRRLERAPQLAADG